MRRITLILAAVMTVFTACAKETTVNNNQKENNMKALVVFFSHAGENYSVGNIKIGNTKLIADYISEQTGADQFEIVTHKYDGMAYTPLTKLAQDEQVNDERPAFEGKIDNLDRYDVIFIGGPIWWGTYPQVMFTFFDTYDLNGKTIVPFTTHEGSGLDQIEDRQGKRAILYGSQVTSETPVYKTEHKSPLYTTDLRDIITLKAT